MCIVLNILTNSCFLKQIERAELETKNCPKDERARQLKRVRAAQNKLDLVQQKLVRYGQSAVHGHHAPTHMPYLYSASRLIRTEWRSWR